MCCEYLPVWCIWSYVLIMLSYWCFAENMTKGNNKQEGDIVSSNVVLYILLNRHLLYIYVYIYIYIQIYIYIYIVIYTYAH